MRSWGAKKLVGLLSLACVILVLHLLTNAQTTGTDAAQARVNGVASDSSQEDAIVNHYNNYLREYHLGPEDVISVQVFDQPDYSKSGIVVPPTARIAYPLIRGGIFVGGKTTEQVGSEIAKALNEYIIDPQVTVTLEKVGSAKFGILGMVAAPGVKMMNRRLSLYEAIAEAGGVTKEGDKKRVLLVRRSQSGVLEKTTVDLSKLLAGNSEMPYLLPGDQIIVPEKKWSLTKVLDVLGRASAARILFGSF